MQQSRKHILVFWGGLVLLFLASPLWAQQEGTAVVPTDISPLLPPASLTLFFEHDDVAPPEPELKGEDGDSEFSPWTPEMERQLVKLQLVMQLFSGAEPLRAVHVKIGNSPGASDVLEKTYQLDQPESTPGYEVIREGKHLQINCGERQGIARLYAEVVLEDRFGQRSQRKQYTPF